LERLDGGISGRVAGRRLRVGSLAHLARARASADALKSDIASFEAAGHTVVGVANENHDPPTLVAVAALADVPRAGSREAIAQLRRAGLVPEILSGDGAAAVRRVADAVDVRDARAGVEPEEKLARIAELQNAGAAVVMVGDGVNDAAALAAADVGVAVHGGAEVSLAAADVFCSRSGLLPLADLVRLSRRAMGTIRANLVVSVAYNVVGIALAAAGLMSPLVAAVLMPLSSLTVLTVALLSLSRPFSPRRRRVDGAPAASDRPAPQTPAQAPSPFLKAPRSPEGTAPCP
ncbi:MAG: HAD-IC family P-type ATPase, partial [Planctomycetota bacterium]